MPDHGPLPETIKNEVENIRNGAGLTQAQMAESLGVKQSHYANIIRGHDDPGPDLRNKLRNLIARPPEQRVLVLPLVAAGD